MEVWGPFAQTVSKRAMLHLRGPENGEPLLAKPAHDSAQMRCTAGQGRKRREVRRCTCTGNVPRGQLSTLAATDRLSWARGCGRKPKLKFVLCRARTEPSRQHCRQKSSSVSRRCGPAPGDLELGPSLQATVRWEPAHSAACRGAHEGVPVVSRHAGRPPVLRQGWMGWHNR